MPRNRTASRNSPLLPLFFSFLSPLVLALPYARRFHRAQLPLGDFAPLHKKYPGSFLFFSFLFFFPPPSTASIDKERTAGRCPNCVVRRSAVRRFFFPLFARIREKRRWPILGGIEGGFLLPPSFFFSLFFFFFPPNPEKVLIKLLPASHAVMSRNLFSPSLSFSSVPTPSVSRIWPISSPKRLLRGEAGDRTSPSPPFPWD